jgi:murein DD-endopeptidase MepM/ murein hydrolase activator NlpD
VLLPRDRSWRPSLAPFDRLGHERTVAIAVAAIVLVASFLSVGPSGSASAATGGPAGDGPTPRLAVGGGERDGATGDVEADYVDMTVDDLTAGGRLPGASAIRPTAVSLEAAAGSEDALGDTGTVDGPFLADGTLLKPVAVDMSVEDGSDLVTTYKVKAGDTLVGIAKAHGVSMMTLWWANKLKNKDDLHRGQILKIPPVSGLVLKVKAGDTLPAIATKYKVSEAKILETNEITDPNLVVGQVLIVPGARGKPIATPEPTKSPTKKRTSSSSSGGGGSSRPPRTYSGGNFRWPTTSRHISQYYHYGHYGLDIDGSTGDPIFAAAGGTVTFAGWKSNGGGYQVWIAHGSGLYTTYNHMSSVSVGRGQHVSKGQRVGRMGATGFATGSHLHFEVWKGPIWNGGRRINPLRYL